MHTKFWEGLIKGRKYEEEVALFFESQGFNVWRLGDWRLPIDLFIWNEKKSFCVEVKYRTKKKYPIVIDERKLYNFLDINCVAFLIAIHPDCSRVKIYKTIEWGESWLSNICFLSTSFEKIDYKEINWHEVLSS